MFIESFMYLVYTTSKSTLQKIIAKTIWKKFHLATMYDRLHLSSLIRRRLLEKPALTTNKLEVDSV
jgi:hypothetical protein